MPVVRVPLVGSVQERTQAAVFTASQKDAYFENCIFQKFDNPVTGNATIRVRQATSPTSFISTGGAGEANSVMVWTGKSPGDRVVSAFGTTNGTIYDNTTSLGAITGKVKFFSETTISGTATIAAVSSSNRAWYYVDGGALTEITDTDFPAKQTPALTITGNFIHHDGYAFIAATNGTIWNSDLNSIANWSANSFITAQNKPDGLVGLAKYKDYICALGKYSVEFFKNDGNPVGSPLGRMSGTTINVGCISEYAILQFGETVAWVGAAQGVSAGVYVLEGMQAKKISTPLIDEYIASTSPANLYLQAWCDAGHYYLLLRNGVSSGRAWMFDPELGLWSQMNCSQIIVATDVIVSSTLGLGGGGGQFCVFVGPSGGDVYGVYGNNRETATIIQPKFNAGTMKKKKMNSISVIGDGIGIGSTGITVTVSVETQDQNFVSLGTIDTGTSQCRMTRCGTFRNRAHKYSFGAGSPTGTPPLIWLESVEYDFEVCET